MNKLTNIGNVCTKPLSLNKNPLFSSNEMSEKSTKSLFFSSILPQEDHKFGVESIVDDLHSNDATTDVH